MSLISRDEVQALVSDLNSATYDTAIDTQIPIIEEYIVEYCNYCFTKYEDGYRDDYTYFDAADLTFANSGSTITDNNSEVDFSTEHKFAAGDSFVIKGSRKNDGVYDIKTITDTVITVGDLYSLVNETTSEDYTVYFFLIDWPKPLKLLAAQMIEYNILRKYNTDKNVTSEKIGDYSVSFGGVNNAGIYSPYPKEIMDGLTQYKRVGTR